MKAISIRAPWWWYIVHGYKDIENRDWRTIYRGRVLIHASRWWRPADIVYDLQSIHSGIVDPAILPPSMEELKSACGCVVGAADITGCVTHHQSRWFFGDYGFVLRSPVVLRKPVPQKGALGIFELPGWEENPLLEVR